MKWIMIEDEYGVVYQTKNNLNNNNTIEWFYVGSKKLDKDGFTIEPIKEINSTEGLVTIFTDNFDIQEECILLLDLHLDGIINSLNEFSNNIEYINSIKNITKCKKHLVVIISSALNVGRATQILGNNGISNNKIIECDLKTDYAKGISNIEMKWNSLYESLTIEEFITEFDKISLSKGNKPNFHVENEEYIQGRDIIKRLIRLDDDNFNIICPSDNDNDNIFSGLLKGLFEHKGISLFGIYLIVWATYSQTFNNHELFLEKFKTINGNWSNFSRSKMFISWKNDESKKIEHFKQIVEMFQMLLKCNHFHDCKNESKCASYQSVLKDIQIDPNLLTLSFDLCIDGKVFEEKFNKKVNSLFSNNYDTNANEASDRILKVMKNTWGKNSGISFEISKVNYLKIKFYIV
jgi:hypothetical protein